MPIGHERGSDNHLTDRFVPRASTMDGNIPDSVHIHRYGDRHTGNGTLGGAIRLSASIRLRRPSSRLGWNILSHGFAIPPVPIALYRDVLCGHIPVGDELLPVCRSRFHARQRKQGNQRNPIGRSHSKHHRPGSGDILRHCDQHRIRGIILRRQRARRLRGNRAAGAPENSVDNSRAYARQSYREHNPQLSGIADPTPVRAGRDHQLRRIIRHGARDERRTHSLGEHVLPKRANQNGRHATAHGRHVPANPVRHLHFPQEKQRNGAGVDGVDHIGMLGTVVALAASASYAVTLDLLLIGISWSLCYAAGSALLTKSYTESERSWARGVGELAPVLGQVLGSVLAGVLLAAGWKTVFVTVLAMIVCALIAMAGYRNKIKS